MTTEIKKNQTLLGSNTIRVIIKSVGDSRIIVDLLGNIEEQSRRKNVTVYIDVNEDMKRFTLHLKTKEKILSQQAK